MGKLQTKPLCPNCKRILDGFGSLAHDEPQPVPGDVTVCVYCKNILEFTEDMTLKPVSSEAIDNVDLKELQLNRHLANILKG